MSKWDEDVKKSLAKKKAASAPATLTKPQQALIQAQLAKELTVRQMVAGVKKNLERGLHFVRSLVAANVDEFRSYLSSVASLLLDGALARGSQLVGSSAIETYLVCLFSSVHACVAHANFRTSPNAAQSVWTHSNSGWGLQHSEVSRLMRFRKTCKLNLSIVCRLLLLSGSVSHWRLHL